MEGIRTTNALRPSGSLHVELLVRCLGACQNQLSIEALYLEGADCTGRKLIMSRAGNMEGLRRQICLSFCRA
jgi:hypothetical protein